MEHLSRTDQFAEHLADGLGMNPEQALPRALAMEPDRPGVGRLCQELLAAFTGEPVVTPERPELMRLPGAANIGNRNRRGRA